MKLITQKNTYIHYTGVSELALPGLAWLSNVLRVYSPSVSGGSMQSCNSSGGGTLASLKPGKGYWLVSVSSTPNWDLPLDCKILYEGSHIVQNLLPTAFAGADNTVQLPTTTATLAGSGTDSDGSIASYQWSLVSKPEANELPVLATPTSATTGVSGLDLGVYLFRLTVMDNLGGSSTDDVQLQVLPAPQTAPGQVGNVVAVAGVSQVQLSWDAPTDGGSIITDYVIRQQLEQGAFTTITDGISTNTSYLVTGLTGGTYGFTIAAKNAIGTGPASAVVSVQTDTPTLAITEDFSATATSSTSSNLNWLSVPNATNYVVERSTSSFFNVGLTVVFAGFSTNVDDENLIPDTTYHYRWKAQASGYNESGYVTKFIKTPAAAANTADTFTDTFRETF